MARPIHRECRWLTKRATARTFRIFSCGSGDGSRGRRIAAGCGVADAASAELRDDEYAQRLTLGNNQLGGATLPGGPFELPRETPGHVRVALESICAHRFDLLGSGPVHVVARGDALTAARRARFERLVAELPRDVVESYEPIEWHSDFIAGYRWNPTEYYLDVRIAPRPGADIKVPRELSRFQHVGVLAAAGSDHGLRDRAALETALEVADWIAANPVRRGVNWASAMDVAMRAVNWVWALRLSDDWFARFPRTREHVVRSLYEHGLHIEENLEYAQERTGNHYLANLAGLLYVGAALPQFVESDRWVHLALQELVFEMGRQVYADGASFEASTSYHRLVLEIFLSCASLAERLPADRRARLAARGAEVVPLGPRLRPLSDSDIATRGRRHLLPPSFYASLARMADFTAALTKPNGLVPQIGDNDSARLHKLSSRAEDDVRDHGHALEVAGVLLARDDSRRLDAAGRGGPRCAIATTDEAVLIAGGLSDVVPPQSALDERPVQLFANAGVAVLRRNAACLIVTCGANGQLGHGGHGHNDKGSFELSIGMQDYIVDGGSFVYSSDPVLRNRFRATSAHSTLWLEGREQDPLPQGLEGLFTLPQHSHPRLSVIDDSTVIAEHDGFGTMHRRTFSLSEHNLVIEDRAPTGRAAFVAFNLDPAVRATVTDSNGSCHCLLEVDGRAPVHLRLDDVREPRVDAGFFSMGYGVRVSNQRIVARLLGSRATSRFEWNA